MHCPNCNFWNLCPRCNNYICEACGEELDPSEEEEKNEETKKKPEVS